MGVFELVLALLLAGAVLTLLAPRLCVPWPALLALAGTGLAFVPGIPAVSLDPGLALALFVAPVLLDSAYDASPRDLRDNWAPVGALVLIAVSVTVGAVAAAAHALMPALPWAACLALGAIVAPPDAAAATAVLRLVRLPHRVLVILEGESLLNDASALIIYRLAVSAVAGGITVWTVPLGLLSALGGGVLGFAMARLYLALTRRVEDGPAAVLLQFLGTFGVWLCADALHLSAVLTVVAYAITIGRHAPGRSSARHRRASYAVWETAVFVLNVLAFILVGLQLRGILGRLEGEPGHALRFAGAILGVTILARIAWVMTYNTAVRWKNRRFGPSTRRPMALPTFQGGLVVAWCGMRGIVTLAAALALPADFPARDLLVFAAYAVVLGTLVIQGLTLRPLLSVLQLPADDSVAQEVELARAETARAALRALDGEAETEAGHLLAQEFQARIDCGAHARLNATGLAALREKALAAERARLLALRRGGDIGDDAFHRVEEELDWAEAELRVE